MRVSQIICGLAFSLFMGLCSPVWSFGFVSSTKVGTRVERGGWSLTLLRSEKTQRKAQKPIYWNIRLENQTLGVDRRIPLAGLQNHAVLEFYLYPELKRFVVFEPQSNYRKNNRLLIFSFDGQRQHALGLKDLLREDEMDFASSDYGIYVFRETAFSASMLNQFRANNRLVLTTHTGRNIEIMLMEGKVVDYQEPEGPPLKKEEVIRYLQDILKVMPPLPENAMPAQYTYRYGQPEEKDFSRFHLEGVWISPKRSHHCRRVCGGI